MASINPVNSALPPISVVVVLYNDRVGNISCLATALASPWVKEVIVCDNSTGLNDNAYESEEFGATYISMKGNAGLPAAYSEGVRKSTGEIICFFDDDTVVTESYFSAIARKFSQNKALKIGLPLVMADNLVLSPCEYNGIKAKAFASPSDITDSARLSGINSGMAVRREVFAVVQHDRGLFLDFVDHKFIEDARKKGVVVSYIEGPILKQNLSLKTDNMSQALARYRLYVTDSKYYFSGPLHRRLCGFSLRAYRAVKLGLRYKTSAFIRKGTY
ncbi:glycosyltransferase [Paratractidigestivibacter sp.]|uniref:glycosyltransferase n=1 Tax=Paratractidigestivibacter sp. TaxID=2847316 RepID=UPI002ACB0717|nr:glycosyltransferase [Paratractidigestivibacter sp.]